MKKVTMIIAVAFVMFAAASCGSKSTSEEVVADSVEVVEADTISVTEEVELDSTVRGEAIQ